MFPTIDDNYIQGLLISNSYDANSLEQEPEVIIASCKREIIQNATLFGIHRFKKYATKAL